MFKLMPVLVLEGEVVGSRDMPAKKRQVHREPRHQRRSQDVSKMPKHLDANQRPEEMNRNSAGQATQQRNYGIAQKKKRRSKRHEQKMLDHMRAQQHIGKAIKRRRNRKPDDSQPKQESCQSPQWKLNRPRLTDAKPAAC